MKRRLWIWCIVAILGATAGVFSRENLRIVPIVNEAEVLVSFELADAYTNEVREAIASGLRTTFAYDVELRMMAPLWLDRTVATVAVSTTDRYDNLTRRHTLSRTVDGRLAETLVTEDASVVGQWLTKYSRLPICRTSSLESGRDYYLRISAHSWPRNSLIGWARAVTGQARFTFVP